MDRRKLHKVNNQKIGKNKQVAARTRAINRAGQQDALRDLEPVVEVAKLSRLDKLKQWQLEKQEKKKQEEVKRKPFVTVVKRGVFLDKTNYTELNKQRRKKAAIKKQQPTQTQVNETSNNISVHETSNDVVATNDDFEVIRTQDTGTVDSMLTIPEVSSELNTTFETSNAVDSNGTTEQNSAESQYIHDVGTLTVPDIPSELNSTFEMPNNVVDNGTSQPNNEVETVDMLAVEGSANLNSTFEFTDSVEGTKTQTPMRRPSLNASLNYVSPFVTIARGKGSAHKEIKVRESFYKLELSQPNLTSPVTRQHREAAKYFYFQLSDETDKLKEMINYWDKYKQENADRMDSVYVDQIDVAIGQTRLLIRKKFKQFSDLIEQCEEGTSQPPVLPKDLEGFWNMVFMQIDNCKGRFNKLNTLKENDWVEVDLLPVKVVKQTKNRKPTKKGVSASSGIQKMIEEARLKMKENRITTTATETPASSR